MSQRCSAKNRNGKRCGAWAVREETQCTLHSVPGKAAEMGSKHGRKVTFLSRPNPPDLPYRPLKSVEEVCELLEETIDRIRQGPFDLRAANAIGFLAGIHLKALSQGVESPEPIDSEGSPGIYLSLFERLGPAAPEQKVFDLCPQPQLPGQSSVLAPLPCPGESIDDPPPPPNNHRGVITVEIG
jgi:hypothetical protein